MASADDSRLHWCTEEIPIGSKYFLQFEQSLTEAHFLGSLQREGSWMGDLPLIRSGSFDISRLQYLVPTPRCIDITSSDPIKIEKQLMKFSQYLLRPNHAFIHLFTNFDFCDEIDYVPLKNIPNYQEYTESLPLFTGNIINKSLIDKISTLIALDSLNSLKICQDIGRIGIGLRCSYPQQYNALQHRFIIRTTINYEFAAKYTLNHDGFDILLMDNEWKEFVNKIQRKTVDISNKKKLWKPLLIHSRSNDDDDDDEKEYHKIRRVSDAKETKMKYKYVSPFRIYDFCQNGLNIDDIISSVSYSSKQALKCANMQRSFDNKISECQCYIVLSINDYETKPTAFVYRLNILKTVNINHNIYNLNQKNESVGSLIVNIISNNMDEYHKDILTSKHCSVSNFIEITHKILQFLSLKQDDKERTNILLLQERAIIILADVIWLFYKRYYKEFLQWIETQNIEEIIGEFVSIKEENIKQLCFEIESLKKRKPSDQDLTQYYGFLEPFLKASNEKELQDFNECALILLSKHNNLMKKIQIKYQDINIIYCTSSGMRVGISSANASDNWTNSKLNGGVTINMSINLDSIKDAECPVSATVRIIPNNVMIRLTTEHTMYGDVTVDTIEFTEDNIDEFLKIDDNKDVFRMLKYSLIFVGIVVDPKTNNENTNYLSILSDIKRFTGGHGLSLSVSNLGPSRSGFASSSAVACNILKVLYGCSGNDIASNDELLGSMALLLENRLGLKSGRQDVDGLLPNGVKVLHYNKTTAFVSPKISFLSKDRFKVNQLGSQMILVNSGIARASGLGLHRGLNMRFLAYLSRDPVRFKSILQSYMIHSDIISALQFNNYCFLGKLFLDYMNCRERIDPGATQSKYDVDENNERILRRLFDPFVDDDLIYGGMFTGAMGGGVAMLSLTPKAFEINEMNNKTNIRHALDELKEWKTQKGSQPFQRLSVIQYSVNENGILLSKMKVNDEMKISKLIKKEYLFKSMNDDNIVCLDDDFAKIVFSMNGLSDDQIKEIRNITNKGHNDKMDVNIVVCETHSKDHQITYKVSHAKIV